MTTTFSSVLHETKTLARELHIPVERVLSDITTETLTCILCNRMGCDYEEWGDIVTDGIQQARDFLDIYDDIDTKLDSAKTYNSCLLRAHYHHVTGH